MMGEIGKVLHNGTGLTMIAIFGILLVLLLVVSGSARAQLKKVLFFLVTITILATGYYYITGRPITQIPHQINGFFNGHQDPETTSHRYYRDPEEGQEEPL